jgi:uncharacterized membrane protein YadS
MKTLTGGPCLPTVTAAREGIRPPAKARAIQLALFAAGVVFCLSPWASPALALALYLFPMRGEALNLSQVQFGAWAGIAIHDIREWCCESSSAPPPCSPSCGGSD